MAGFQASSVSLRLADAVLANSYAPPIAPAIGQHGSSLIMQSCSLIPKTAIVVPVRENMPMAPTFCLVRVFCTAETKAPAPVVIIVAVRVAPMASFGWYLGSSGSCDAILAVASLKGPGLVFEGQLTMD